MTHADEAIQHLERLGAVILDDVGDGPPPADLAAAASAARDAVARLAVPALTQLTGLIAGVTESLVGGATEWSPSLGGTLMAAVDDLRHLASRASQFSDEDSEHLHHRAAELSAYVKESGSGSGSGTEPTPPAVAIPTPTPTPIIPIGQLFYADGPHIVSGGMPPEASGRSDLLGRGIDALDSLTAKPITKPAVFAAMEVVPVETLLYRGRAALERAVVIRELVKASGGAASPAALDEMYDLIGLALKD
ncbi:MAG: hypothetical protein ABIR92_00625 [Gemmatimonadaceae bacterium]